MKRSLFLVLFLLFATFAPQTFAQDYSFASIVNPIRGNDFWDLENQKPETAVSGQIAILDKLNLPATWLLRFDALNNSNIADQIKNRLSDEKGLFLEVTPAWTNQAGIQYYKSDSWHNAGSAFLTGYIPSEREKLIDASFEKFKGIFGYYPLSVGAWWIDSYSLGYMQKKYGIISALIVSDQYSTDNYQIWGQYFGTPFYPAKNNALHPAQALGNKLDVVMMQWALRDPLNAYGNGVSESTFSVQANDYLDYHNLDISYFSRLIDIYTNQKFNQFTQIIVGLENSYDWSKYSDEYRKQMEVLNEKRNSKQISIVSMKSFAAWYKTAFPQFSPTQLIVADDPLGSFKKVVWFMNPYYRAALFINEEGVIFRDIRQYVEGEEELCFKVRCSTVNFATFATRVLDDVTYGHKWLIDEGKIKDFSVSKESERYLISYINEAGNKRRIEFLPRDIKVDDTVSTIDGTILSAIKQDQQTQQKNTEFDTKSVNWSILSVLSKLILFLAFLIFACLLPGLVLTKNLYEKNTALFQKIFLSTIVGFVLLTIIFYITSLLNLRFLFFGYLLISLLLFFKLKPFISLKPNFQRIDKLGIISLLMIISGTIFQIIPTFRSGLVFSSGMGFWGPNTHDGVWHISLINQLIKGLPAENPILAGLDLKNYHFFYDLLMALTSFLTTIPILDLVFRFYPVIFSVMLGMGTYYLVLNLFESKIGTLRVKVAAIFSLYFVYFAGSFGWIVEYLKQKTFGGESAFWANQSISFNLNPPFAISLLIIIAFLHIYINSKRITSMSGVIVSVLLLGSLAGFKSYAAILMVSSLIPLTLISIMKKELSLLYITILSAFFSLMIYLFNFQLGRQLIIFYPFWFVHSLVDSADRVGWDRLSIARTAGFETRNWFKFISAEIIGLFLFIAGNLGMRILSIVSLIKFKQILNDNKFLFILVFSVLSIIIPILFIQSGNPWNMVQFFYYGLYITSIVTGVILSSLIFHFSKVISTIIGFVVLLLTPINSITTASYYLGLPHAVVSSKELKALEFLSRQPEGKVLTYPYDDKLKQKLPEPRPLFVYDSTAYVSALSRKSVFIEDEPQNQILLTDYKKRLIASKDFFLRSSQEKRKFLDDNKIQYIYIPKISKNGLDEVLLNINNIFENDEVIIYRVK